MFVLFVLSSAASVVNNHLESSNSVSDVATLCEVALKPSSVMRGPENLDHKAPSWLVSGWWVLTRLGVRTEQARPYGYQVCWSASVVSNHDRIQFQDHGQVGG